MPTIAFSDNFMFGSSSTVMGRLMSYNEQVYNQNNTTGLMSWGDFANGIFARAGLVCIMKGTVPTNFTTLTDFSSRSADVLVQWSVPGGQFTASPTTNPASFSSSFAAASASGTATWFWWMSRGYRSPSSGFNNTIFEQIVGTVGVTGSGADLEISSTSITAGQLFRVIDLRLQLATSFNY